MNPAKYNRNIQLHCTACEGKEFAYDDAVPENTRIYKCASCGKEYTRGQIRDGNKGRVDKHFSEAQKEAVADVRKKVKSIIKKFNK